MVLSILKAASCRIEGGSMPPPQTLIVSTSSSSAALGKPALFPDELVNPLEDSLRHTGAYFSQPWHVSCVSPVQRPNHCTGEIHEITCHRAHACLRYAGTGTKSTVFTMRRRSRRRASRREVLSPS